MYTQEELKAARTVISRYAESKGISEEQLREQMKALFINAIEIGDPTLDSMFADMVLSGDEPSENGLVAFMYRQITGKLKELHLQKGRIPVIVQPFFFPS